MKCKVLIVMMLLCSGCGSELANIGGGFVAGGALSNTITGAEKDLEAREEMLIERYNKGVADGVKRETLDQIEKDIYDTRLGKQTLSAGKKLFSVDWQDPKAAGGGISLIASLAYAYYKRKDLLAMTKKNIGLEKGINRVKGEAAPELAKSIHDTMKIYKG